MAGTAQGGLSGLPPTVLVKQSERAKYEAMWNEPEYRAVAPGEHYVERFLEVVKPLPGETLIDFGCGTGRAGVQLNGSHQLDVTLMDFASNCLDEWVVRLCDKYSDHLRFVRHDLTQWPYPVKRARYGFCTDCMEHIPTEQVHRVLWNIVRSARSVFFAISTKQDALGDLNGAPLHLTVQPHSWWKERLEALHCKIMWEEEVDNGAFFYVTAFADTKDLYDAMKLNVDEELLQKQIVENLRMSLQEICPHETQEGKEVILLAGGPSLNDFADEIYEKAKAGIPVVTVNGTYNWALSHRIRPAAQVCLDGRQFNKRFVDPVMPGTKYLLSSQCHPDLVSSLPRDQVWLWHSGSAPKVREAIDEYVAESGLHREWYPVYGGSTVTLRAIVLLRMLGFAKLHIYGFDSCCTADGEHHAYAQPENDSQDRIPVKIGGRTFRCHTWMLSQANEFMDLMRAMNNVIELEVYGDGLIAHIIKTASEMPVTAEPSVYGFIDDTVSNEPIPIQL